MTTPGKLIVFEGPDAVGKSTLAREVAAVLNGRGTPCDLLAFPGHEPGTLGWHFSQLHHDPARFGVAAISPASLLVMHVAAHLDAIAGRVLPALAAGRWVVLDRFWWTTWANGLAGGVSRRTLDSVIALERSEWGNVQPEVAFLVQRSYPLRDAQPADL
jgi:thymidylate kinase